jgi:ribosomal protein S18 acetylase RimI-like enzyme
MPDAFLSSGLSPGEDAGGPSDWSMTFTSPPTIRTLHIPDAQGYRALRLRALRDDPAAYLTSAEEYEARTLADSAARLSPTPNRFTLGAFVDGELRGMTTLVRSESPKQRHRAEVFAVYVAPEMRGLGLGRALLDELIRQARSMPELDVLNLSVTESQTAARRLYERLGFTVWGVEQDALRENGAPLASLHLSLRL